jgi:hypothetical protein
VNRSAGEGAAHRQHADRRRLFCSFPKDQPGHGLPRFAKLGAPRTHREPLGTAAHSFLNRRSAVRIGPGAPGKLEMNRIGRSLVLGAATPVASRAGLPLSGAAPRGRA